MDMERSLTANEAMEMGRFLNFAMHNRLAAQSAADSLIWPPPRSGPHNLEEEEEEEEEEEGDDDEEEEEGDDEEEDEAAQFFDQASDDNEDDVAYQSDDLLEFGFGYLTEQQMGRVDFETVVLRLVVTLNLMAQRMEVDFETVLRLYFGSGDGDGDGGGGLLGAFVVPASDAAIAGLQKQAFHATAEEGRDDDDDDSECGGAVTGCAICLEEFDDGEEVTVMPCSGGHEFHTVCITKWLGRRNTCPLCRHALPTDVDDDGGLNS